MPCDDDTAAHDYLLKKSLKRQAERKLGAAGSRGASQGHRRLQWWKREQADDEKNAPRTEHMRCCGAGLCKREWEVAFADTVHDSDARKEDAFAASSSTNFPMNFPNAHDTRQVKLDLLLTALLWFSLLLLAALLVPPPDELVPASSVSSLFSLRLFLRHESARRSVDPNLLQMLSLSGMTATPSRTLASRISTSNMIANVKYFLSATRSC